jgi:hypothetical protein
MHARFVIILSITAFFADQCLLVSSSSIPMFEFLSRDEKVRATTFYKYIFVESVIKK